MSIGWLSSGLWKMMTMHGGLRQPHPSFTSEYADEVADWMEARFKEGKKSFPTEQPNTAQRAGQAEGEVAPTAMPVAPPHEPVPNGGVFMVGEFVIGDEPVVEQVAPTAGEPQAAGDQAPEPVVVAPSATGRAPEVAQEGATTAAGGGATPSRPATVPARGSEDEELPQLSYMGKPHDGDKPGLMRSVSDRVLRMWWVRSLVWVYQRVLAPGEVNILTPEAEQTAQQWMGALDAMDEPSARMVNMSLKARRSYVGYVARIVKGTDGFGTPTYTTANVLVVRRKVADVMTHHGLRPAHIAALMPMAVALVFCPMEGEVEMAQFMASMAAAERRDRAAPWYRRVWGRLVSGPTPVKA